MTGLVSSCPTCHCGMYHDYLRLGRDAHSRAPHHARPVPLAQDHQVPHSTGVLIGEAIPSCLAGL